MERTSHPVARSKAPALFPSGCRDHGRPEVSKGRVHWARKDKGKENDGRGGTFLK